MERSRSLARGRPQLDAGRSPGVLQSPVPLESLRAANAMLPPLPSAFPSLVCVQSENSLHQRTSPVLDAIIFFLRGKGSTKSIPARRRSVSTPSSLPNLVYSVGGHRVYRGGNYDISSPRQCRSASAHTTSRRAPQAHRITNSANQDVLCLEHRRLPNSYHEPSLCDRAWFATSRYPLLDGESSLRPPEIPPPPPDTRSPRPGVGLGERFCTYDATCRTVDSGPPARNRDSDSG